MGSGFETGFLCVTLAVLELDQGGLELRAPPASDLQVLGLKVCTATARLELLFKLFVCMEDLEGAGDGT